MRPAPLLLEIGCEEIPARMVGSAADELGRRVVAILDGGSLGHGEHRVWGGSRRLAVHVQAVQPRQQDREERVLGPPAEVAFDGDGNPTRAAAGFASKLGVEASALGRFETERGEYVGLERSVPGRTVGELLAAELPEAVSGMWFPKTMRWGDGEPRWVRPVHWLLALHGSEPLAIELFGVRSDRRSVGHRFKSAGPVLVDDADRYLEALEGAHVVADPEVRQSRLREQLDRAASELGGRLVEDPGLLAETANLVEWPSAVVGRFSEEYLKLPRELLVTTLRHHQKCFSVERPDGTLLPAFMAVSNNDSDPLGHIRRGNEWVVVGRLEDARFFWREDRKRSLDSRSADLERVVFHAGLGSYADKAGRLERLARRIVQAVGLDELADAAATAARLAKNDLVTGTVGEFPELQGQVGGLLVEAEGGDPRVASGIYGHYRPAGPDDSTPEDDVGAVVSVADKLDSLAELVGAGEAPTGSRDPFGLRRAGSGIFRIAIERGWPLTLASLARLAGGEETVRGFLLERFRNYLREQGYASNEVQAVFRPRVSESAAFEWSLHDIVARLDALQPVREREDFAHLVDLTKRVDNILSKNAEVFDKAVADGGDGEAFEEDKASARELLRMAERCAVELEELERGARYGEIVGVLAKFVDPVERFFVDVLVIDPENPDAMLSRRALLDKLRDALTRCFDIRELAGQAERRS